MRFFVGLDWASEAHAVCVIDSRGGVRWRGSAAHSASGLAALVQRLRRWRHRGALAIAIERPSGVLVDTLVQAGFEVVPIHPNVVKASRPRYSAAGGKSDPGDAFLLADLLRTDGHRFRSLQPPSDDTRALRTLVRGRDDLVAQRVALANQLRALLERVWPGAARIFADVDSPIALAFPRPLSDRPERRALERKTPGSPPRSARLLRPPPAGRPVSRGPALKTLTRPVTQYRYHSDVPHLVEHRAAVVVLLGERLPRRFPRLESRGLSFAIKTRPAGNSLIYRL
jgi:transposase